MGVNAEDYPHTGGMYYANDVTKIPAVAISTIDADLLSSLLREEKDLQFYFKSNAQIFPDAPSRRAR